MAELIEIPKGDHDSPVPCWIPRELVGRKQRPFIKCNCGKICNIQLHHIHADGVVTGSFYDSKDASFVHEGRVFQHQPGCGWHVNLKLLDYDQGEFKPTPVGEI